MVHVVSLAALAVSLASACVACAVWWTNREKLRLDLYNRRFDIYNRTLDFYHALLKWNPSEMEMMSTSLRESPELEKMQSAFIKASREAQFLFDDNSRVHKRLEQLNADAMGIIGYKRDVAPKLNGPDLLTENQKFSERWNRIHAAMPLLEQGLSKYLDFHRLTAWR
jgi:hypothetical protein